MWNRKKVLAMVRALETMSDNEVRGIFYLMPYNLGTRLSNAGMLDIWNAYPSGRLKVAVLSEVQGFYQIRIDYWIKGQCLYVEGTKEELSSVIRNLPVGMQVHQAQVDWEKRRYNTIQPTHPTGT